jgi:hypothetical protein
VKCAFILSSICFLLKAVAGAVVVASGGANNSSPSGQPFFDNVGQVGGASGIYLGNGWVLTANHVASSLPASAIFGGNSYNTVAGSWQRLQNPAPYSTFTDIVIFRLATHPPLPTVTLSSATPTVETDVMMIGRGRIQNDETFWLRTVIEGPNNDTWVVVDEQNSNISGFTTSSTQEIRWGENQVHQNFLVVNTGSVDVLSFSTSFDASGKTHEAQGVVGDSGGGVFIHNGTSWELAGMMFSVALFENQPGGSQTAVYGNQTFIADLSVYSSQFEHLIPEPSTSVVAGLLLMLALTRRHRDRG